MRWLLAAAQRAQRQLRLTNLLLLLLRCLIVLLAALALARPSWSVLGRGGHVIFVIDQSASMGSRGASAGPLASVARMLVDADLPDHVVVASVADRVRIIADGTPDEARQAVQRLAAMPLPGGIDRAADPARSADLLAILTEDADVVLVSDFQQDDGTTLSAMIADHVRSVHRWAVGMPAPNSALVGIERIPDLLPGTADDCLLTLVGSIDEPVRLAIDGGPAASAGESGRLAIPPLEAGDHRLAITITDQGLVYDNRLELPLHIRGAVPVVLAQERTDFLAASLLADGRHFASATPDGTTIPATALGVTGLPPRGLVVVRGRSGAGERLLRWIASGGVLWAHLDTLREEPELATLVSGIALGGAERDRPFVSGMRDLDDAFAAATATHVSAVESLPPEAEVLLRSGDVPLVIAIAHGRGRVVIELADLAKDPAFTASGATPLWVERVVRRLTAAADEPLWWEAGRPAVATVTLRRAGLTLEAVQGEPLLGEPGAWTDPDGRTVMVTPNHDEARIDRGAPSGSSPTLSEALPPPSGADWGLPLLIAALLVLFIEGSLAAWAGRVYGR
jgi:hypothetical protein